MSQGLSGNDFTGDYTSAGTTTTQENNGFAAGSTSYTETSIQSVVSSETGNALTGDYQLASTTTTNTTLTDTGSNAGGSFSVGSSDSGTQTRSESGNHQDGSYSASTGSTDSYSWSQTDSSAGPSFTLTATGSTVASGTDVGNRVSGDYSTTQSGTEAEIHSLENLRGIPKSINSEVHLSQIRIEWNRFYKPFIESGTAPTKAQLLEKATEIDLKSGSRFTPPVGGP